MNESLLRYRDHVCRFLFLIAAIEVLILLFCWIYSWDRSYLTVRNPQGNLIYERHFLTGAHEISKAEAFIEATSRHEGLASDGYQLTVRETSHAFPVRAWISASIAVPLAVVLFLIFVLRSFCSLFETAEREGEKNSESFRALDADTLHTHRQRSFPVNAYVIGGTVFVLALLFWWVPELLMGTAGFILSVATDFPVLFWVALLSAGGALACWALMRHRLQLELIRQQADLQRRRDELTFELKKLQLRSGPQEKSSLSILRQEKE